MEEDDNYYTIIQLSCGSSYGIRENLEQVRLFVENDVLLDNYFIPFHFSDSEEIIKIKKGAISTFYRCNKEED